MKKEKRKHSEKEEKMMKRKILAAALLALALIMTACGGEGSKEQENGGGLSGTVALNGSTSVEKVIGALSEAFTEKNPDVKVTYDPTGSGSGISAVSNETTDIGLSSRDLKAEETGLTATVFALDGIAMVVHPENPVEDLTLEQIAGLADGTITNWSEVGGPDAEVVFIGREAGSGTRDGFESIAGVEDMCVYQQELNSTGAVIAAVSANPQAIGYASLASVNDTVKAVKVEGVEPMEDTVLDGTYILQRNFNFITNDSMELSEAAKAFIEFAKSPEAKTIIANAGAVQPQ